MKLCITTIGPNLDSEIDPRFGRCAYFLLIDEKEEVTKAIPNTGVQAMRGAGVSAAQIVANEKVDIVITGNIGPNAYMVLSNSGIKVFPGVFNVTAKEAFKMYKEGKLKEADGSVGFGPRRRGSGF